MRKVKEWKSARKFFEVGDIVTMKHPDDPATTNKGVRVGVIMGITPSQYAVSWIVGQGCLCFGCLNPEFYKKIGNVNEAPASNLRVRTPRGKRS